MSNKNKNSSIASAFESAKQAGIVIMAAAATLGLVEVPDHNRVVLPTQPIFAPASATSEENNNPIRREKEDTEQHYISYSEVQRTPSRSGRH